MSVPSYRSAERRILIEPQISVAGATLQPMMPPVGFISDPSLGAMYPEGVTARRVYIDTFTCHPRAIATPGGDFLLMFAAGEMHYAWAKKERRGNVMLASRSADRGKTWSEPAPAYDIPYSQHAPILFVPRGSKRIYCFGTEPRHDVYDGVENAAIGYRTSDDDGRSWSDVTIIRPTNAPDFRGMSAMRMCETASGAWLVGSHAGEWDHGNVVTEQYLLRSEDQGRTWTLLPGPRPHGWQTPGFHRMEEGRPIHLGNDRVLLMVRTPEGRLWELRSDDAGRTWGEARPTTLSHPDAPPMLFHLADGKTLICFHHNIRQSGSMTHRARAELWYALSQDDGQTWTEPRVILANTAVPARLSGWEGSSPMVSYADLLVDGDNLHLFVDHQVRQVLHLQFNRAQLHSFPTARDIRRQCDAADSHEKTYQEVRS